MPIPENPQSRSEQYLNAIATGDNSGLPEFPQSRMEQYLEVIAQNGGGSSGGGALVVTCTKEGSPLTEKITANKTSKEIYDAYAAGTAVVFINANVFPTVMDIDTISTLIFASYSEEDGYSFTVVADGEQYIDLSGGANEYPAYTANH